MPAEGEEVVGAQCVVHRERGSLTSVAEVQLLRGWVYTLQREAMKRGIGRAEDLEGGLLR